MKTATVRLKSVSPYSQSKMHCEPKRDKEAADAYEERTWIKRAHTLADGTVVIPPMALKNCLGEAAKYLGMQIKGKGKATYTKHFDAGVLVTDPVPLGIKITEVRRNALSCDSQGKAGTGGGKRVTRFFPTIDEWEGEATFHVLDETITKDVFEEHIRTAGKFIGIGQGRPRNRGYFGRFDAEVISWK